MKEEVLEATLRSLKSRGLKFNIPYVMLKTHAIRALLEKLIEFRDILPLPYLYT
jgi:hypothetical protein